MAKAKSSKFMSWILIGLLVAGLGGYGAANLGAGVQEVGTVGEASIDVNRYARSLDQELRAISAQAGRNITLAEAEQAGLTQQVLGRLITQAAFENEAARLGLSVGDEIVAEQIAAIPAFAGIDGNFDIEGYRFALERIGMSPPEFEEDTRRETSASLVQRSAIEGIQAPDAFFDALVDYVLESRTVTWAQLGESDLQIPLPEPSDAQLATFHEENAAQFTLPPTREITFAWLTPNMIQGEVEVDELDIRNLYEERIDQYVRPERRLVERLVFPDQASAKAAMEALTEGTSTFEDEVEARGLSLGDIDLGDVTDEDLGDAGAAVFALTQPDVVGPLPSQFGPAIFRMNAILSADEVPFDLARDELRDELSADRARRVIDDSISEIDDLLAGGATLEELNADTDMQLGSISWSANNSDGIAAYDEFRQAAALVQSGDFPEILELSDGGIFALRLDGETPAQLQPLSDVRPQVAEAWERAETTIALRAQAEALGNEISAGADIAETGLNFETVSDLTRDGFVEGTPPQFVNDVFAMEPGDLSVVDGDGAVFLVRLDDIVAPDPEDGAAQNLRLLIGQQTNQAYANDMLTAFGAALTATAGININQTVLNSIHAQFP